MPCAFVNLNSRGGTIGLFPFEKLKDIHRVVSRLGFGPDVLPACCDQARKSTVELWRDARSSFLAELERGVPVSPDSPFLKDKAPRTGGDAIPPTR